MYTRDELSLPGIKISNFQVDKLVTYFEPFDALISNAVSMESMKDARGFNIIARQNRLNCKPFNWRITINSDRDMKVYCRIFLGPSELMMQDEPFTFFKRNWMNYIELDKFLVQCEFGFLGGSRSGF